MDTEKMIAQLEKLERGARKLISKEYILGDEQYVKNMELWDHIKAAQMNLKRR